MNKAILVGALILIAGSSFVASADQEDYSCQFMRSAYRKILGAQVQISEAKQDKTGDLQSALVDTDPVLTDITAALTYKQCASPDNEPAKVVSLIVGSSLYELNHCPHRFYMKRYVIDAINSMKTAEPIYDGHRAAAIESAQKVLDEVNSDLKAVNDCEGTSSGTTTTTGTGNSTGT
jgi:hypothetical protein